MHKFTAIYNGATITVRDKCKAKCEIRMLDALEAEGCELGEKDFPLIRVEEEPPK